MMRDIVLGKGREGKGRSSRIAKDWAWLLVGEEGGCVMYRIVT